MKAPEVGGAGVPAVLKEGQPGPHPGAPLRPTGSVPGSGLNIPDVPGKDMEPGIQIQFRACGEPALLRVVRASVDPAVDLLDLLSEVAKLRQHFRLEERNRHGDHGQGQNTASVLDGLVRVGDYGVDGSSHVLLQKKEKPLSGLLRFVLVCGDAYGNYRMIYPVLCHYLLGLFCTLVYTHLRILSGVLRVRRGLPLNGERGDDHGHDEHYFCYCHGYSFGSRGSGMGPAH